MNEPAELIVEFVRGTPETEARQVVAAHHADVRRRMRTDHADQVMLLVRVEARRLPEIERAIRSNDAVTRTEPNQGGFGIR